MIMYYLLKNPIITGKLIKKEMKNVSFIKIKLKKYTSLPLNLTYFDNPSIKKTRK